jgi:cardiolipin synthase
MKSVLGTILDPAADKALMTTLTVTLTMKGLIPCQFPAHTPLCDGHLTVH